MNHDDQPETMDDDEPSIEERTETVSLRDGESAESMGHAARNAAMLRQAREELGRAHALDTARSRAERIRAHRLVNEVAPCGPQGKLTSFDVFGEVRTEVAGSILLAAGEELTDLGVRDEDDEAETDGGVVVA